MIGFVAFEDGEPVRLELSDEITGGLVLSDPVAVFATAEQAEEAAMSNQSRYGSKTTFEIKEVTLVFSETVNTVTYDEDEDVAEEDEEDGEDEE